MRIDLLRRSARCSLALSLLLAAACASEPPPPPEPPLPEPVPVPESEPGGAKMQVAADPPPEARTQAAASPGIPPLDPGVRDARKSTVSPRSSALLVTELQQLETLFTHVEKTSPDRPNLARRLAEVYDELASAKAIEKASATDPALITKAEKVETASRRQAIKYYQLIADEYPRFCVSPGASSSTGKGCLDEALYFLGLNYETLGMMLDAQKVYFRVVRDSPQSIFVPYVYFSFGEIFLREAQADSSKLELALQSFEQALKYNEPTMTTAARGRIAFACDAMSAGVTMPELCAKWRASRGQAAQ